MQKINSLVFTAVSFFRALSPRLSVDGPDHRHGRVRILRTILKIADWALRRLSYQHEIIVRMGQSFVCIDGIRLSLAGTNRYLKLQHSQGWKLKKCMNS